ncbi:hypothetical protein BDW62DRAFT_153834 [Aspergillus aurantiobrunneus]
MLFPTILLAGHALCPHGHVWPSRLGIFGFVHFLVSETEYHGIMIAADGLRYWCIGLLIDTPFAANEFRGALRLESLPHEVVRHPRQASRVGRSFNNNGING